MKCQKCKADNPKDQDFCGNCGAKLEGAGIDPTASFDSKVLGPGSKVGQFRIERELGRGAVGIVYLAHDTKLDRSVAIKSLPEDVTANPLVKSRFQREARLLAGLNHPNIATIYDELQEVEDTSYLVLEYIAGDTLAERIEKGAMSIDEALSIGQQIAEAVAAAHEQGVIHRDLKPGNIKITPDGKVKVLDFGLAKAVGGESADQQSTITVPGRVIGTPAYMSPEQARGNPADHRSDIWSFGCILFEMLTGLIPFKGDTVSDTLANILQSSPEWEKLPDSTPANIKVLIRRCMEKDQQKRLGYMGDAALEISETIHLPQIAPPVTSSAKVVSNSLNKQHLLIGVACLVIVAFAASLLTWLFNPSPSTTPTPITDSPISSIILPEDQQLAGRIPWAPYPYGDEWWRPHRTTIALSPDGELLVYSAVKDNEPKLYLRWLDQFEPIEIPGTEGGIGPFFSSDGEWVGFCVGDKLKKVRVIPNVEQPQKICDIKYYHIDEKWVLFGASWWDDMIVFGKQDEGLYKVSAAGGSDPEPRTTLDEAKGEVSHRLPHILPGGKAVLFTVMPNLWSLEPHIEVYNLQTEERKDLELKGADARYVPSGGSGHLVFARQGDLMAVGFDLGNLEVIGKPVPLEENIMQALNTGWAMTDTGAAQYSFSTSGSGRLVYVKGGMHPDLDFSIVCVDRKEGAQKKTNIIGSLRVPRFSLDGQKIYYTSRSLGNYFSYWIERSGVQQNAPQKVALIGNSGGADEIPNHEGWISYESNEFEMDNIFMQRVGDNGSRERLSPSNNNQWPGSWSPDGKFYAFCEGNLDTFIDIWVWRREDRQAEPFIDTKYMEGHPAFSPKDNCLAYSSTDNVNERLEVYVCPYPGGPNKGRQITTEGGHSPVWDPNGQVLYYLSGTKMMAVDFMQTEPPFEHKEPRELFEIRSAWNNPSTNYDISSDSREFVMILAPEIPEEPFREIRFVQNWFKDLNQRVPIKKY